ncbi:transposase [Ruminococcus sp.]
MTDEQWEAIQEFFPSGNKSKYHKRSLVEAVLYIVKTGCQWRMLPHDYPPHDTVWSFYRRARNNGVWDKIMGNLDYDFSCCYALRARVHRRLSTSFRQILLHTALKILAIRKYACKFLPCLQKNLLENPHIFPMNTSS